MAQVERIKLLDSDLQKCVLTGPLSRVSTYALHITGPWGVRELDNLVRMLQLQREWLGDPEVAKPHEESEGTK